MSAQQSEEVKQGQGRVNSEKHSALEGPAVVPPSIPREKSQPATESAGITLEFCDMNGFASEGLVYKYYAIPLIRLTSSYKEMGTDLPRFIDNVLASANGSQIGKLAFNDHGRQKWGIDIGEQPLFMDGLRMEERAEFARLRGKFAQGGSIEIRNCYAGKHEKLMQDIANAAGVRVTAYTGKGKQAGPIHYNFGKKVEFEPQTESVQTVETSPAKSRDDGRG